jgi:hypothetical protein
LLEERKD